MPSSTFVASTLSCLAACCVVLSSASAQQQTLRSFQRVTAPVHDAGVYHVASGTWTRATSGVPAPSTLAGGTMDTVYACTSGSGYFAMLDPGEVWSASGRIPSPSAPNVLWNPAAIPAGSQPGIATGCSTSYQIDGFRIAYCTDHAGPTVQVTLAFFESWDPPCTSSLSALAPQGGPFTFSGLPGRGAGALACWQLTFDLSATTASFAMHADGDGFDNGGLPSDGFGWTFTFPSITSTLAQTGVLIAGAPSDATGPGTACNPAHPGVGWLQFPPSSSAEAAGYDSRRFDDRDGLIGACVPTFPANASSFAWPGTTTTSEAGSDMLGDDAFRIDSSALSGCFFFGGPVSGAPPNGPYANFFLELYAKTTCLPPGPGAAYCAGDGLLSPPTVACPCGNFGAIGNGCASSFNPAGANLTAVTTPTGFVILNASGMQASGACIFLKGNASDPNAFRFGDGISCTGGSLVRLHAVALAGGAASFPVPPVTVTLAGRGGNTVGSGQLASYTVFYRNSAAAFCPPFSFNATNNYLIFW